MNDILYLTHPLLDSVGIKHGFFTRQGGVSQGEYAGLNVSKSTGDDPKNVEENRKRVTDAIGFHKSQLILNCQVHSAEAVYVDAVVEDNKNIEADGLVTTEKGLLLGVMGADCPPVLFSDPENKVIGAAHAGWPGAKKGVLEATIDLMINRGAVLENIRAVIGPSIAQKSYEVDQKFYTDFVEHDSENIQFFKEGVREGHYMFDLKGYCAGRMKKKGLTQVVDLGIDTYTDPTRFFSNRRRFHMGEENYGVTVNVIGLVSE